MHGFHLKIEMSILVYKKKKRWWLFSFSQSCLQLDWGHWLCFVQWNMGRHDIDQVQALSWRLLYNSPSPLDKLGDQVMGGAVTKVEEVRLCGPELYHQLHRTLMWDYRPVLHQVTIVYYRRYLTLFRILAFYLEEVFSIKPLIPCQHFQFLLYF